MTKDELIALGVIVAILANVANWVYRYRQRGKDEGSLEYWRSIVDTTLSGLKIRADANMANVANDLSANHATQSAIERTQAQIIQWQTATDKTLDHLRQNDVEHFEHAADHELHMSTREKDDFAKRMDRQDKKLDDIHSSIIELVNTANNRRLK